MIVKVFSRIGLISLILGFFMITACDDDKILSTNEEKRNELYSVMSQWYYWVDSISTVDPEDYVTADDLLEAMRFLPKDKWSYITNVSAFTQYYDEGTFVGYGFGYSPDDEGNMRVSFVYDDSDLANYGIERGWIIKEINSTTVNENTDISDLLGSDEIGVTNSMKFESPIGQIIDEDFSKKLVTMNTVLNETIINTENSKVGYFVFKNFIGPSENELDDVFSYLKSITNSSICWVLK